MFVKLPVVAFAGLALINGVRSQKTTATVFPGNAEAIEDLKGEIVGTGELGTTYIYSGVASGIPMTATLVEGSTYLSQGFEVTTEGGSLEYDEECGFDEEKKAICTAAINIEAGGFETGSTAVVTATISLSPIELDVDSSDSSSGSITLRVVVATLIAVVPAISFGLALL